MVSSKKPRRQKARWLKRWARKSILSKAYKPSFESLNTKWGSFYVLKNRRNYFPFFDSRNWLDFRPMRIEEPGGHSGHRFVQSYEIIARHPETGVTKEFVLKDQELGRGEKPDEIERGVLVRMARVRGEKPVGYWKDKLNHHYAIFERMQGKTLLLEKTQNFSVFLHACRQFGKLFRANLFHDDTGLKHVFAEKGKLAALFDFETLRYEPRQSIRENDFGFFLAEGIAHGWIKNRLQFEQALTAFMQAIGVPRGKEWRTQRIHWMERMKGFLNGQLEIEEVQYRISSKRKEKKGFAENIRRLKQMLNWIERPARKPFHSK